MSYFFNGKDTDPIESASCFRNLLKNLLNLFEEITKETQSNSRPDPLWDHDKEV